MGMSGGLRVALCQINATVGDLDGNAGLIKEGIACARGAGAELVLFPELALTGYPPEDLLLREHFLTDAGIKLHELAGASEGVVAVVGFPERAEGGVYNAAAVLAAGEVRGVYRKLHLPNYGVFDEQRYFKPGSGGMVFDLDALARARARGGRPKQTQTPKHPQIHPTPPTATHPATLTPGPGGRSGGGHPRGARRIGVTVCEDLWVGGPPATEERDGGASLIVNVSASPYHAGKGLERERLFAERARETGAYIAFCAMVGGQDELVFDGHSFVLSPTGETIGRGAQFVEDVLVCDLELDWDGGGGRSGVSSTPRRRPPRAAISPLEHEVYEALLLGLRDYVEKNGFGSVVLGLSGGIDSALVACLAVDALGAGRVNAAIMPSAFSSEATQSDARALARALGVQVHELPIEPAMGAYLETLAEDFEGLHADLTEENLQARIRGNLLMALSNKFGWLVLTTGNKSEMSVGYTTLYGDLAGGFAVIKDVGKTLVYRLARWRNGTEGGVETEGRVSAPIPASIIERAPSAELREGQRDEDSLPPYELLDRILHGYVELGRSREQLIAEGLPAEEVERATRLVDRAEYKRRQAPPGIKITERAFGRDRRMPITNAYRG
jgi:NAD+ synthase (glutamine-hydrolysing)